MSFPVDPSAWKSFSVSHQAIGAVLAIGLILYALYGRLLPRPIPGIPYNAKAARSLMGDVPDMLREVNETGEFRVWCAKQMQHLQSPICQIFIRPLEQPWVLLSDFHESKDILTKRKEFDKSSFLAEGMACMGSFHGIYMTGDDFKANRQLIQDLMTTTFLNTRVGPAIYDKASQLMRIFDRKNTLAQGRPFSVKKEFEFTSLDVMVWFAFGKNWTHSALATEEQVLSTVPSESFASLDANAPAEFPEIHLAKFLRSVYEAPEIVEKTINAVIPRLQTWWWSHQRWYREIFEEKDRTMQQQIDIGLRNVQSGHAEAGIELMLMRERSRAEKEGREPVYDGKVFRDEMFGNIVGGHHTTSGAMMWITKYLTDYPEVQQNLRAVLQEALSVAWTEGRLFTFEEIRQAKVPYLDAVVEEMFRINAVPVTREAQCDTVVLGYPIKKGTQVFVMSNGPGYVSPALASKDGTLESKDRSSRPEPWSDAQNLTVFDPERWLVRKNNGQGLNADNVTFDGAAGPQLAFGMGPRTCWGRRLAYMEIKVVISMLVWSFELQPTPAKLSDHSGLEGIARVPKQCYVRLQRIFPSSSREVE